VLQSFELPPNRGPTYRVRDSLSLSERWQPCLHLRYTVRSTRWPFFFPLWPTHCVYFKRASPWAAIAVRDACCHTLIPSAHSFPPHSRPERVREPTRACVGSFTQWLLHGSLSEMARSEMAGRGEEPSRTLSVGSDGRGITRPELESAAMAAESPTDSLL
jgi:hypothetical protein